MPLAWGKRLSKKIPLIFWLINLEELPPGQYQFVPLRFQAGCLLLFYSVCQKFFPIEGIKKITKN
jgi:hypothetical protein